MATAMVERSTHGDPNVEASPATGEPMGCMGRPEEIAAAAVWPALGKTSFATGEAIAVDGGWTAR
jgi:NAD(P)-dependent dehydrogenase (short-subunit alcohol dehydrogenase family)